MKLKNGINLTKSQKKSLATFPNKWVSESEILSLGIGKSVIRALQSKGCIHQKTEDGSTFYIKTV